MRIAYFSPLNPQKSGISDYSEYLLQALSKFAKIDVWVEGFMPSNLKIASQFAIIDYVNQPSRLAELKDYDEIIYNIGNNPYYHNHIYDVFLKYNGIVILHELVLYYLISGYYLDLKNSKELYLQELNYNHGQYGINEGQKILKSSVPPLQFSRPETLPLNKRLIDYAKAIIVHSDYAKRQVELVNKNAKCFAITQIGPEPVLLSNEKFREFRNKYKIEDDETVIASFGFVAPSKRIHQVIRALSNIRESKWKYILAGEGDYVNELIHKYNLDDKVILTGYTSIEEFDDLIAFSDIIVNLRYPYMGETSASLIRALKLGKATIVSDIGWFSELPDDVVMKIPIEEDLELKQLTKTIELLMVDLKYRSQLQQRAKNYGESNLQSSVIAKNLCLTIYQINKDNFNKGLIYGLCDRLGVLLDTINLPQIDEKYTSILAERLCKLIK